MKKTKILIVSGFLGSGKTTFIKKFINDSKDLEKTVIIENEFGEASIDGQILESEGINVREINSGCICCSLSGSFINAIEDLKNTFNPDTIVIEPSGIAKLSEIIDICEKYPTKFEISQKITIVDPSLYMMYTMNFGEFYIDQIKNSSIILFSRYTKALEDEINFKEIIDDIKRKNEKTFIVEKEWNQFDSLDLVYGRLKKDMENISIDKNRITILNNHHDNCECNEHQHHDNCVCNEQHHDNCVCGHSHNKDLDGDFESILIESNVVFSKEDLENILSKFNTKNYGEIIRSKGTVKSENKNLHFNFVPEEINIENTDSENIIFVVIGRNLHREKIRKLFS